MYHQPSKRKQLIQRIVVYGLMSLSVITLVTVLVFVMLGYQFNRTDGRIEQGGLVQFSSQPSGANVSIDGKNLGTRTTARATIPSGQHFITMQRDGYQPWQKSVDVVAGSVLWLDYVRFVPTTLTPVKVAEFTALTDSSISPDRRWLAIKDDAATPTIHLQNISGTTVKASSLELPATSYTQPAEGGTQQFTIAQWDPGSRYLLIKHSYDDKNEWLVVDIQDVTATKNMTTMLGFDASDVVFSNNNNHVLYGLVGQTLRKIDINAATLSGPLVGNVAEFSLYRNNTILYTTLLDPTTRTRTVGYYDDGVDKARTIRSYSDDGQLPLHMAFGSYFNKTYVAISYGSDVEVLTGSLPRSDDVAASSLHTLTAMTVPGGVIDLSIVTSGRFVFAQTADGYVVYDLELQKTSTTTLKGPASTTEKLHWLDGYTVRSDRDGVLRLSEFDGANQQDIMPVTPGFSASLSPDGTYLYGFLKTAEGKYELQRVRMILP